MSFFLPCRQRLCAVLLTSLAQPMGWTCLSSRMLEACELQSKDLDSIWSISPCDGAAPPDHLPVTWTQNGLSRVQAHASEFAATISP